MLYAMQALQHKVLRFVNVMYNNHLLYAYFFSIIITTHHILISVLESQFMRYIFFATLLLPNLIPLNI